MEGFEHLDAESGHGAAWVRLAHITAIRVTQYREGTGEEHNLVSVLAGGEWFRDPVDHPTPEAAQARAEAFAGTPSMPWLMRLRDALPLLGGGGRPGRG